MIERRFADVVIKAASYEALDVAMAAGRATGWGELLNSRRIMIYAEAGAGKTHECIARAKILWDAGVLSLLPASVFSLICLCS